jgi:hypothetical protein
MVSLAQTSVPTWALEPEIPTVDPVGRSFTLLGVGAAGAGTVQEWHDELIRRDPLPSIRVHPCDDADAAVAALRADLATATVGLRVMVAGAATDCLVVRAAALGAGLEDDELRFGSTDTGHRLVECIHCGARTSVLADLDDEAACSGCARTLVVYPHVSRLRGTHLGFMADAEDPRTAASGAA